MIRNSNHISVMFRISKSLGWGFFIAGAMAAFAQANPVMPQGVEYSLLGNARGDQVWPSLSLSPTAGVIVWQNNMVSKHGSDVCGAMLNADFTSNCTFRINNPLLGNHLRPKVQLLANNNLVTVWQSAVTGTPDIYARLSRGKTKSVFGTNFYSFDLRANTYLKDQQGDPDVAALHDGSAIITWSSYGQDGSMWGVYARKLSAKGVFATAKEFRVNQYTAYNQRKPAVATLANGDYVICWVSEQERFYNSVDVYARIFTPAGVAVTDEIPINSGVNPCDTPDVAPLNDGGFTVVWAQKDLAVPTNSWDIWGRAFAASGSPEGADFRINTFLYGDQYRPKIAAGPSGSLVVWTSMAQDGSREGVFGRFLQGGTAAAGSEMQINTVTVNQQLHPAVAWNGVNSFLVVWSCYAGASGFDLHGQPFSLNTTP